MKSTSKLIIFGLTVLALVASTIGQEPSLRERFEAATAAVKKAEAALAQAKSAAATAEALDDKEALSISQQAVAIAERSLTRANKAKNALEPGDPKVVDARNVPSDLPKGLDNAITSAYADAPPGVSDRVRKGFQAVMARDWKVAKAWFEDALNRDPSNASLKNMVKLTEYRKDVSVIQLPTDSDLDLLFTPDDQPKDKPKAARVPIYMLGRDGKLLQLPDDYGGDVQTYLIGKDVGIVTLPKPSDLYALFPGSVTAAPRVIPNVPMFRFDRAGKQVEVPNDYDGVESRFIKGKDGGYIQLPNPADTLFPVPGTIPAATPNPASPPETKDKKP